MFYKINKNVSIKTSKIIIMWSQYAQYLSHHTCTHTLVHRRNITRNEGKWGEVEWYKSTETDNPDDVMATLQLLLGPHDSESKA